MQAHTDFGPAEITIVNGSIVIESHSLSISGMKYSAVGRFDRSGTGVELTVEGPLSKEVLEIIQHEFSMLAKWISSKETPVLMKSLQIHRCRVKDARAELNYMLAGVEMCKRTIAVETNSILDLIRMVESK